MTASCLGGTLLRHDDGTWHWCDGTPEPRVEDLTISRAYSFRCRTYGGGGTYVEVPIGMAREEDDLSWVLDGRYGTSYDGDRTGRAIGPKGMGRIHIDPRTDEPLPTPPPKVYLVPVEDWDARPPCGATWLGEHEADILAIARRLGWTDPR